MSDDVLDRISKSRNLYKILDLDTNCTSDQIKSSYRRIAACVHPDKCKDTRATDAFQKVSSAYKTLIDPDKRKRYDMIGDEDANHNVYVNPGMRNRNTTYYYYDSDVNAEEIFREFFGNGFYYRNNQREYQNQRVDRSFNGNILAMLGMLLFSFLAMSFMFKKDNTSSLVDELKSIVEFVDTDSAHSAYYYFKTFKYKKRFRVPKTWIQEKNRWFKLDSKFYQKVYDAADIVYESRIKSMCKKEMSDGQSAKPSCVEMKTQGIRF